MSTADWTLLDDRFVLDVVEKQSRKVAEQYQGVVEVDDLRQEAYIAIATHPRQFRAYLESGDFGLFAHALWCDLTNVAERQGRYLRRTVPIDPLEAEEYH